MSKFNTLFVTLTLKMKKIGNILVVEDNAGIRTTLELLLPSHFQSVVAIASPNLIHDALRRHPEIDVVLLDMNFHSGINNGNEGLYWLREIKKLRPLISVVLFTAYSDIALAVEGIRSGAMDFIEKPWNNEKLIITLQNGVQLSRSNQKIRSLKSIKGSDSKMFWGSSPAMAELRAMVMKVAPTDANILILGENGTGKDMLAREIHALSSRSEEHFVSVDMGAISESLFESELFGYVKGAFTDAKGDKIGKIEAASGGTLFLDEVGNIPMHLQSKLLSALQSRSVVRVGENVAREVDVRLITATNANVEELITEGKFREDLYYRINTFIVHLPPLRERADDIMELSTIFMARYGKKYAKSVNSFSQGAQEKLLSHTWSGNIRELQHTIEKGVIIAEGSTIEPADLLLNRQNGTRTSTRNVSRMTLEEAEKEIIRSAMEHHRGNISEVASHLGITRQTLYNKLKRYDL